MSFIEGLQALAFVLMVGFVTYVTVIVLAFLRHRPNPDGDPADFDWHVIIPCRDEETVIAATLRELTRTFPELHVWVVDDDSSDKTSEIVLSFSHLNDRIHLVQRVLPEARQGKGPALNAGYRAVREWLPISADHSQVIIVVLDADGRLSPNALSQAASSSVFGRSRVGAAQVAVWMSNRNGKIHIGERSTRKLPFAQRLLVRVQDIEFRTTIAAMQFFRGSTLSVGLGGNGQFTRLTVLEQIADTTGTPWHGSLLEDYELGLHVLLEGYRTVYIHDAHVEQEALPSLTRLITQRTRWCQGGMQCVRYLPTILRSPHFTNAGALETSYFMLQPFVELIGVFVWPTVFIAMIVGGVVSSGGFLGWLAVAWWLLPLIAATGIVPFAIWPLIYRFRCERLGPLETVVLCLAYWLYMYQSYVVVVRAALRIVRGRNGWAKTQRNNEITISAARVKQGV